MPCTEARYAVERAASGLTAQVVVRCNGKVADAYKLDKKTRRAFRPDGAIAYDDRVLDRILRWYTARGEVSLWAVGGRLKLPFVCGEYQRRLLAFQQGESDLAFHGGNFYLLTTCNLPARLFCLCCGLDMNADANAASNIGVRAAVRAPIDAPAIG